MQGSELPPKQIGPAAWLGPDMEADPTQWLTRLTADEINELQAAAEPLVKTNANIGAMRRMILNCPLWPKSLARCDKN